MNIVHLAEAALAGFLVSLLVCDMARPLVGAQWPQQREGLQWEKRILPWILALAAGPALLWDASRPFRLRKTGTALDLVALALIFTVWSACYGLSLGWLVLHGF
nr:hypothetical protein [uncultured Gellertiella sp.]